MRVSIRLSSDDEESFKEAVRSLHFNNPPSNSNPDSLQGVGSSTSSSMLPEERNEDDPNITLEVRRVAVGSNTCQERSTSEDI